jgi:outer membrane lipoprotein SlyB
MIYGKNMLDKIKSNKNADTNKVILDNTKGTLTGSAIGLFVGLYIGYNRDYSLLVSGVIGALVGGAVSKFLINKK